jgi:transposase
MSQSQAPSATPSASEFAALIGLDWADQKHCWKLIATGSLESESGELNNTPEALQQWATDLHRRFAGRPVAVALEQRRGAVVFQLSKFPHVVVYPVHPTMAAKYRQAFFPSGTKNDPLDSTLLLELLLQHRDRLRRLDPDTPATRLLQLLVEHRRKLVDEKTRQSNRLTAALKSYYPQPLQWFDDIDAPLGCAFLQRWPTLEQAQHNHPGTLRKFFTQHNCRAAERIRERIEGIHQATPAVTDPALLEAGADIVSGIVRVSQALNDSIAAVDAKLQSAAAAHPEAGIFASLPGVGNALLPRLIAAFGTQRDRYPSAVELQCYTGIAPVRSQTGHTEIVQMRRACPKFVRQTFAEFAIHSVGKSVWARAFLQHQLAQKKDYHVAIRALAFKWLRILHACWRTNTPYDEARYLQTLQKRNSPLAKLLTTGKPVPPDATSLEWKPIAGFHRLAKGTT